MEFQQGQNYMHCCTVAQAYHWYVLQFVHVLCTHLSWYDIYSRVGWVTLTGVEGEYNRHSSDIT